MLSKTVVSSLETAEPFGQTLEISRRAKREMRTIASWPFIAYLLSIGGGMSAALLVGLLLSLTQAELVAVALAAGGLIGGIIVTILELYNLHKG